jgi:hypothetical protein
MKNRYLLIQLFIGFLSSYFVITTFFSGETKFDELALGTETVTYLAVDAQGKAIHLQKTDLIESDGFVKAWKARGSKPVTLFLGNSQTHSINQQKESEVNYVELLHKSRLNLGTDIMCISIPNAGLQEFYLIYDYWKKILPIKCLIVPVFMDDMREDGIRDYYFADLIAGKYQISDTSILISKKINRELQAFWSAQQQVVQTNDTQTKQVVTFQEVSESFLNGHLERYQVWANRPNLRGEFFNWLYKLRNSVFGIKASTVRRMIPQRYTDNMEALRAIMKASTSQGKKVIVYIPPIRYDVKLPYDSTQYISFKKEIETLANSFPDKMVVYKNFESIISGDLWGYKAATNLNAKREIDYMHCKFKGHQILADSLDKALDQVN